MTETSDMEIKRIEIIVIKTRTKDRIGLAGLDAECVSEKIFWNVWGEARQRYPIEDLPDETVLGEIVLFDGEWERTEWNNLDGVQD